MIRKPKSPRVASVPPPPTADVDSLRRTVEALIEIIKPLTRDRRAVNPRTTFLTVEELLRLGVVTEKQLVDLGIDLQW